jgi:hypothetical protein
MSNNNKHTPGPWSVCGEDRGVCQCVTIWSETADCPVATCKIGAWGDSYPSIRLTDPIGSAGQKAEAYMEKIEYGSIPDEMAKANAILIALAPEMLELINDITRYGKFTHETYNTAKQLLIKVGLIKL